MRYVDRLPDCYRKDTDGNNFKLLSLNETAVIELRKDLDAVRRSLDLKQASGKTLDLYGTMLDQQRGPLTDEQYRYMLFSRIGRNYVKGDYQSIMKALAMMFGAQWESVIAGDFELIEDEKKPCLVRLTRYPEALETAGFTVRQIAQMIKGLLPVCVALLLQFYGEFDVPVRCENAVRFSTAFYPRFNLGFLYLDDTWTLDNTCELSGYDGSDYLDFYPVQVRISAGGAVLRNEAASGLRIQFGAPAEVKTGEQLRLSYEVRAPAASAERLSVLSAVQVPSETAEGLRMGAKAAEQVQTSGRLCITGAAAVQVETGAQIRVQGAAALNLGTASFMTREEYLDGSNLLDGSRLLNGGRYIL